MVSILGFIFFSNRKCQDFTWNVCCYYCCIKELGFCENISQIIKQTGRVKYKNCYFNLVSKIQLPMNWSFFSIWFSFTGIDDSKNCKGREGSSSFLSTNSTFSRTVRHLFATLNLKWPARIFNCTACSYQTVTQWDLSTSVNQYLTECYCILGCWFNSRPYYSNFFQTSCGFEIVSIIILVLQMNRLTKCASHPKLIALYT